MSAYALETTKNEIENGYRDLTRLMQGSQIAYAVAAALGFQIRLLAFIREPGVPAPT